MQRGKLLELPLLKLRKLRSDIDILISELESSPRRELDIAVGRAEAPDMPHEVIEVRGGKRPGGWRQLEKIYCSLERCPNCPHGPYWYRYRANKRKKTVTVAFAGKPFFDHEFIQQLRKDARPGKPYIIQSIQPDNS